MCTKTFNAFCDNMLLCTLNEILFLRKHIFYNVCLLFRCNLIKFYCVVPYILTSSCAGFYPYDVQLISCNVESINLIHLIIVKIGICAPESREKNLNEPCETLKYILLWVKL